MAAASPNSLLVPCSLGHEFGISRVKENIKSMALSETMIFIGTEEGLLHLYSYIFTDNVTTATWRNTITVDNKPVADIKIFHSLNLVLVQCGGVVTAYSTKTLSPIPNSTNNVAMLPKGLKASSFCTNEPNNAEKELYYYDRHAVCVASKGFLYIFSFHGSTGFEIIDEIAINGEIPTALAWMRSHILLASFHGLFDYDLNARNKPMQEINQTRHFFYQPILSVLPTEEIVFFAKKEAYFYNERGVEIRPSMNFSEKILGAVFSFPYLIVLEKKTINVIPLYRSKEQTNRLECLKGLSLASYGRFIVAGQQCQVLNIVLPPFKPKIPPRISRQNTISDYANNRNTVVFRLDGNPLAVMIEEIVDYEPNSFKEYITTKAREMASKISNLPDAKTITATTLSQIHSVLLSLCMEFSIRELYDSSKGLLCSHIFPFIYDVLMSLIMRENKASDDKYADALKELSDATLEDFDVDPKYLLSKNIKKNTDETFVAHLYQHKGDQTTLFESVSFKIKKKELIINRENIEKVHVHQVFFNKEKLAAMWFVRPITYEVQFSSKERFDLFKKQAKPSKSPPPEKYPYQAAADLIIKLPSYSDPCAKLECIFQSLQLTAETIGHFYEGAEDKRSSSRVAIGADDLVLVYAHVLLRAKVPFLQSEIAFVSEFAPETFMSGKYGYCLATLYTSSQILMSFRSCCRRSSSLPPEELLVDIPNSPMQSDDLEQINKSLMQFNLSPEEKTTTRYRCTLHKKSGWIYITQSYLCFHPIVFSPMLNVIIPIHQISCLQKAKFTSMYKNSLRVFLESAESQQDYLLSNVPKREVVIEQLLRRKPDIEVCE